MTYPVLELPTDYPRPAQPSSQPRQLTDSLKLEPVQKMSEQLRLRLPVVLLAAFKVLLRRYTGQTDLLIAYQEQPVTKGTFRLLQTDLSNNLEFAAFAAQVQAELSTASIHSTPLSSQVAFIVDPPSVETNNGHHPPSPYDLQLTINLDKTQIKCAYVYNATLFQETTIKQLAGHYEYLLSGINARTPIMQLPLLPPTERHHLLTAWNGTTVPFAQDDCLHTLFMDQVERTPNACALTFCGQSLTYRELNQRANQLAHHLRLLGIGPEVLVGVCMERSIEMVVALLAIHKAGGAYLPLDPTYPAERIAYMLADTAAPVILTHHHLLSRLPTHNAHVLCLDTEWTVVAKEPTGNLDNRATAANLAYIIYTSGSTGHPKGVAITHHNAVALIAWAGEVFSPQDLRGVLAVTSICFDLSVFELFLTLSQGGTVILARDALHLLTLPEREQVTLINTVPSAIAELVRANGIPDSVRTVNLAGEPLQRVLVQQVYAAAQIQQVYNLYGPSEDTTYSTYTLVAQSDAAEPTIGRPIANTQAYILDEYLQPVPPGVAGELYLGGAGVSRCYLNRPGLTAEKYIPNPFGTSRGALLYRTGDLVRYLSDGQIAFLGRIDHQVKIRGFRIELGEIESVLSRHTNVYRVVVVARPSPTGEKQLVAYLSPRQQPAPSVGELRRHVQQALPDYMIPTVFMILSEMPLTLNGKINRKALPEPEMVRPNLDGDYASPRNETEMEIAAIWQTVLGLDAAGIFDDFFELGGHSLHATQVISRLNQQFGCALPFDTLFHKSTISALATTVIESNGSHDASIAHNHAKQIERLPLTLPQREFWFLEKLVPNSPVYNVPVLLAVHGRFDVAVLEQCLQNIVIRHESLRARVVEVDNQPELVVRPPKHVTVEVADYCQLPAADRERSARHFLQTCAKRPFNIAQDQLIRAYYARTGEESGYLLLVFHHITFDGWSTDVVMREIEAIYPVLAAGETAVLPELPVTYTDFALWQDTQQDTYLQTHLPFWLEMFQTPPVALELPTNKPRPSIQSFHGARVAHPLPAELIDQLQALGQKEKASLFMVLLAAFQVLLARYSGQSDIVVGAPIAGRNRPELESIIGLFLNSPSFRADLSDNPTFRELLQQVRQTTLGVYAHQEVPADGLFTALKLKRDPSRNPFYQVMLAVQIPIEPVTLPDAQISFVEEMDTGTSKLDLTLFIEFPNTGPRAVLEYNTDLFSTEMVAQMLRHFEALLQHIVTDADCPVAKLVLLPTDERKRLLTTWNATTQSYPADVCVHDLVAAQAVRMPDAVAVRFEESHLTYRQLDQYANQLAHRLQEIGVGPETLVGVYMIPGLEMMVGLMGILKAGGAYLPLDPAFPAQRLAYMLQDAAAPVLITQPHLVDDLPPHEARVVSLSSDWALLAEHPKTPVDVSVTSENLAYILYTSGSTGKPKGVQIQHWNVVNFLHDMAQKPGLAATDRLLAVTTLSFDISVLELFLPLTVGAQLIVLSREAATDATQLQAKLAASGATIMQATPATWRMLVAAGWKGTGDLTVLCGGEALPRDLASALQARSRRLWNLYGPTETTIWSTRQHVIDAATPVSIGRPIANTKIYILDKQMQPVPVGVSGELFIGGDGLARGYRRRPALTAEKFVPHPFSRRPGARLYRTGDLARYQPDGNIEFLGRADFQVKVRGYRIELNEIESGLRQHEAIQEAVVIVREDSPGEPRLAAYLVAGAGMPLPKARSLRNFLQQSLPLYMVPTSFTYLDAMPMTANNKINRRALPIPDRVDALVDAYVAPRTEVEEMVAQFWCELLNLPQVGIHDNFFALGGHSLLGTQMLARLATVFELTIPLRILFDKPTVATLATHIEEKLLAEIDLLAEAAQ